MIYEINFLVLQSKTAELEKIKKDTKKFIETFGAKIIEEKEYLKRKLAYEIQHENYGFFTVLRFEFKNAKNLDELKIKLNQKTDVARYIIVRAEDLPSLKEQDAKELEKSQGDKKSIKSEDVEKVLTEQKKAETAKKEVEVEKKERPIVVEKKAVKEKEEEIIVEKKKPIIKKEEKEKVEKSKKDNRKTEEKEAKEKISLDELDKKLDEILNS